MKLKAVMRHVPQDEGGGYWAEVPAFPGCMTSGDTYDELLQNLHEAIEGRLSIDATPHVSDDTVAEVIEITV